MSVYPTTLPCPISKNELSLIDMKKMALSVFGLLLIPSLAFASWWNPFTWFLKKVEVKTTQSVAVNSTRATTTIKITTKQSVVIKKSESTTQTPVPVASIQSQTNSSLSQLLENELRISILRRQAEATLPKENVTNNPVSNVIELVI